jgi:hypothetical protein
VPAPPLGCTPGPQVVQVVDGRRHSFYGRPSGGGWATHMPRARPRLSAERRPSGLRERFGDHFTPRRGCQLVRAVEHAVPTGVCDCARPRARRSSRGEGRTDTATSLVEQVRRVMCQRIDS